MTQSSSSSSSSSTAKPPCVRQGLPDCVQDAREALEARADFFSRLNKVKLKTEDTDSLLQAHGITVSGQPQKPFQEFFPKALQVSGPEASVAFAYTSGTALAQQMNRLMRAQNWGALFHEYGQLIKYLATYIHKMEKSYAAKRTLFRGMRMSEQHLKDHYVVGQVITWGAFASASASRQKAIACARDSYDRGFSVSDGVMVMFVIDTYCRGAVVGEWSPFSSEEEVLLMPFLCFEVLATKEVILEDSPGKPLLVTLLQVVKPPRLHTCDGVERLLMGGWPKDFPWSPQRKEILSELEEEDLEEMN
ncbi:unnamed protein product, partial [Polarella glacialis]